MRQRRWVRNWSEDDPCVVKLRRRSSPRTADQEATRGATTAIRGTALEGVGSGEDRVLSGDLFERDDGGKVADRGGWRGTAGEHATVGP